MGVTKNQTQSHDYKAQGVAGDFTFIFVVEITYQYFICSLKGYKSQKNKFQIFSYIIQILSDWQRN